MISTSFQLNVILKASYVLRAPILHDTVKSKKPVIMASLKLSNCIWEDRLF